MDMVFLNADRLSCGSPRETNKREGILTQGKAEFQEEKRQMVGGPFAALSGGMSDVRSRNKTILAATSNCEKITKVSRRLQFGLLKNANDQTGFHSTC